MNVSEETWIAFPVEKKLEVFENMRKLQEAKRKAVDLMDQLRWCLLHHWMKSAIGDLKDRNEKWFFGFVREYYSRMRQEKTDFCYTDVAMPMAAAELAIEWMTKYFKDVADRTCSWHGQTNSVTSGLYQIRKQHERLTKPQEEN